ncbi:MAG: hypothetical protein WCD16_03340 [Paracoccaceae bacterium]
MTRHVFDHVRTRSDKPRAANYMRIERTAGPNRASVLLQRRPEQIRTGSRRLAEFLRIIRGRMT